MNPRKETIITLEGDGFILARHGANHDIYFHPEKRITIPVKRHDFDEDDIKIHPQRSENQPEGKAEG